MKNIGAEDGGIVTNMPQYARKVVDNQWIKGGSKRTFNNAKVSDHFAIIPTGQFPEQAR